MLLDLDQLDAYRDMDDNGVMGGAFGAMGGWGHTVTLCPLTETEPTGQDFGKCGSFAVVTTHNVTANVSKTRVRKSGTGFHSSDPSSTHQSGVEVSLTPTEGKNLGGVGRDFTTASSNDPTTAHDERRFHDFGTMAAGAYDLGIPEGWMAMAGDMDAEEALSPLESDLALEVTPSTAILYGFVRNADGFGLEGVTVTVNGQTGTTDDLGRYIVSGISAVRGQLFVNTERAGYPAAKADSTNNADTDVPEFAANMAMQHNFTLSGANNTVAITGTVTESGTGAAIKGVEIRVDGRAPLNAGSGQGSGKVTTGDDGTYTAVVETQPFNDPLVTVSAHKSGYHFLPESSPVAAIAGANPTANFEGREATEIVGRVTAPGGGSPRAEVTVTAWGDAAMTADSLYAVTTTETGTFSVFVPTLSGTVYLNAMPQDDFTPSDPNYRNLDAALNYTWFDPPTTRPGGAIAVIPGQTLQFGTFTGHSVQPRITGIRRLTMTADVEDATATPAIAPDIATRGFSLVKGEPTNVIEVKWEYDTRNASDAADDSYSVAAAAEIVMGGTAATAPTLATSPTPTGDTDSRDTERTGVADGASVTHKRTTTGTIPADGLGNYGERNITIGVVATGRDGTVNAANVNSASAELAAVSGSIRSLDVDRSVGGGTGADPVTDEIEASWFGPGSPGLDHRIALYVQVEGSGPTESKWEWIVFGTAPVQPGITRATAIPGDTGANWGKWSMAEFDLNLPANAGTDNWFDDDDGDLAYSVTLANLRKATHLRVDTRVDGGDWVKHTPAEIPEG